MHQTKARRASLRDRYVHCANPRSKKRNQRRRRHLIRQKLVGVVVIALTVLFVWLCSKENEDCSAALLTGPLGLIMLFSNDIIIS